VAALRAEGLVVTRQGVGAFVAEGSRRPFRIDADELRSIGEVLQVMELRTGIEVEAAGLAAERATPADHAAINAAYLAIEAALERGEPAVEEDDAFHTAVASAVANPQFVRILEFLGRFMPHQSVRHLEQSLHQHHRYMTKIQREHRDIRDAIVAGAVAPARAAMRRHLLNCHQQYQKVAASLGES
jgi:GntR family transcriptional regulator, transcriptional repressor for pyruvate dehydrogenase complex